MENCPFFHLDGLADQVSQLFMSQQISVCELRDVSAQVQ